MRSARESGSLIMTVSVILLFLSAAADAGDPQIDRCVIEKSLSSVTASAFAEIALACIQREFPNKPGHVMSNAAQVLGPGELHPAFYGCFDWHSSVHGHWMLARIINLFPEIEEGARIREALSDNLSVENIAAETEYFKDIERKSFERTYGWAWLLKLAGELDRSDDQVLKGLSVNLRPLADLIVERYTGFLPTQTYPIRRGVHPNTAFGIAFAIDYARMAGKKEFEDLLIERSRSYFLGDRGCPGGWEPDGDDFFSPCLIEADLMRRVLGREEFSDWLESFLPGLRDSEPESLLIPAIVSDRSDPKIVHLDGLNLSRAWCMWAIASALPDGDIRAEVLEKSACRHAEAALANIASGNYEGEHWLASFAVYLLTPD
ncbi:MAG: DUF2891 domain-containing protein [Candidatus Krumholzibacteriota bacterium]|nr:DUF2891 domain-containing protein [Candidatus Krumholzibacteriota bacterium]